MNDSFRMFFFCSEFLPSIGGLTEAEIVVSIIILPSLASSDLWLASTNYREEVRTVPRGQHSRAHRKGFNSWINIVRYTPSGISPSCRFSASSTSVTFSFALARHTWHGAPLDSAWTP